ncbi:MAG: PASTA domain-containing protein [Ruminococcus sp.]|jgi:stage V sporulation protein D (sporulation-specific penicillin-binding protein)|nr:PASTA domain-containing protein [Ruminococcus sp.]
MSYQPGNKMKRRGAIVVTVLMLVPIFIVTVMFRTSVTESARFQAMANDSQFGSTIVNARRGTIYDANGKILAQSATVFNVTIDPLLLYGVIEKSGQEEFDRQLDVISTVLSEELPNINYEDIPALFEKYKAGRWANIAKQVEKPVIDVIMGRLKDAEVLTNVVYTEIDTKRYYPQNELAAAVIGFTNYEGDGAYGIEKYYNDFLKGVNGKIISAEDGMGNKMSYKNDKIYDAKDGNDIYLTIDMNLQYFSEKYLEEQVLTNKANNRGCVIMMNCNTGEILAMATSPGFDLNDRGSIYNAEDKAVLDLITDEEEYAEQYAILREKQWKNKAITEIYNPGSVFKVVTGSAALEERVVDLHSTFNCSGSITVVAGVPPMHCWSSRVHGTQDFTTAMTNSCNPVFIQIGLRLGAEHFNNYFTAYGFTERTGIDLPGEALGITLNTTEYGPIELASSAFGQTNKITPLQMITAYAAVVNGGYLVTPHVADKIVDSSGNIVKMFETEVKRQVISEETSATMRQVLEDVVNAKNGSNAYIKGYSIGGKSGTSQKIDENRAQGREDLYVSSYCGFAPADDPEIICLVMVDEPTATDENGGHIYYGSLIAAPAVASIFKDALPYLGYYPEYTAEELETMDITVPSIEGQIAATASQTIKELGLQTEILGTGSTVITQVPVGGSSIPRGGKVIIYTEDDITEEYTTVPDIIGMTPARANETLTNADLNLKLGDGASANSGSTAFQQNYAPGDVVPVGTIIEVYFIVKDEG